MNSFDGQQIDTWFKHLYINGCAQRLRNISADKYSYYCWLYWSCNDYCCSSSNTNRKITTNAGNMVLCDVQWSNAESRGYGACKNYTVHLEPFSNTL